MATWHLRKLKEEVLANNYPKLEGEFQPPTRSIVCKPTRSKPSVAADDDQVSVIAVPEKQAADEADGFLTLELELLTLSG